jgi:glycosyltransferase involved in cell wall biosynthesis
MMRIVHLQKLAGIGGAEKHLTLLLPELVKEGAEIHYVYLEARGDTRKNTRMITLLEKAEIHCHRISLMASIDPFALLRLMVLIKKLKPTHLHTHLIHGDFYGACMKWIFPKLPLISTKHGYDEAFQAKYELQKESLHKLKNLYYHLAKFSIQKANHVICISKGLQNLFEAFGGVQAKVSTLYYGFHASKNPPKVHKAEYLLYIGRLIPFKHPEKLMQAYILYRNSGGQLPLRIAGDGSEAKAMQQLLKAAGYLEDVKFMGRVPRPEEFLPWAACLCVSSYSEGFGLVILEAMAAAIPVVAFDGPAMNETIQNGQNGILCPLGDIGAFAQAMQLYCENPELRKNAGRAGWQKLQHMRVDTMTINTLSIYRSLRVADKG